MVWQQVSYKIITSSAKLIKKNHEKSPIPVGVRSELMLSECIHLLWLVLPECLHPVITKSFLPGTLAHPSTPTRVKRHPTSGENASVRHAITSSKNAAVQPSGRWMKNVGGNLGGFQK